MHRLYDIRSLGKVRLHGIVGLLLTRFSIMFSGKELSEWVQADDKILVSMYPKC